jgi:DNA-binding IclR family transcriptional regulator
VVGLHASTAYRLLQNLLKWNYVFLRQDGKYFLGYAFLMLGRQVQNGIDITGIAKPFLDKLSQESGETVYLAIFDRASNSSLYIDQRHSNGNIRLASTVGAHNGIYCSAIGKALMFRHSDDEIREILSNVELVAKTKNTITTVDDVVREINASRVRGYSIDMEESEYNLACIATPIYDYDGHVSAAVSLSGLVNNIIPPQRFEQHKDKLLRIGAAISRELGYKGMQPE